MAISKELKGLARSLKYNQRKALMRLALTESGKSGLGPQSSRQLLDAGLATYQEDCAHQLVLTQAGRRLFEALEELGWLPPD
jgi:hypothetical protein